MRRALHFVVATVLYDRRTTLGLIGHRPLDRPSKSGRRLLPEKSFGHDRWPILAQSGHSWLKSGRNQRSLAECATSGRHGVKSGPSLAHLTQVDTGWPESGHCQPSSAERRRIGRYEVSPHRNVAGHSIPHAATLGCAIQLPGGGSCRNTPALRGVQQAGCKTPRTAACFACDRVAGCTASRGIPQRSTRELQLHDAAPSGRGSSSPARRCVATAPWQWRTHEAEGCSEHVFHRRPAAEYTALRGVPPLGGGGANRAKAALNVVRLAMSQARPGSEKGDWTSA